MAAQDIIIRVLIALTAGSIVGIERQLHRKSAGLRTNMLVAVGAAFYVILSIQLTREEGDVTRIIGQIVTGVGFLGAGIIFREGSSIHGLTTAATIWCSAAIGSMAGAGYFIETLIATLTIALINIVLVPIDKWLKKINQEKDPE